MRERGESGDGHVGSNFNVMIGEHRDGKNMINNAKESRTSNKI